MFMKPENSVHESYSIVKTFFYQITFDYCENEPKFICDLKPINNPNSLVYVNSSKCKLREKRG